MATPIRHIRVDDELWERSKTKAEQLSIPLAEVIRRLLEQWIASEDA